MLGSISFPYIKRGEKGSRVTVVEQALETLGFYKGKIDGDFGPGVEAAIMAWEKKTGRTPEGIIDEKEFNYLKSVLDHPVEVVSKPVISGLPKKPIGQEGLESLFGKPYADPNDPEGLEWWKHHQGEAKVPASFSFNKSDKIFCNKYIVPVIEATFNEIDKRGLASKVITYDGCFKVRPIRGYEHCNPVKYSVHTWGCAIDINAATNGLGVKGDLDPGLIQVFRDVGWVCGCDFKRLDFMHFQWAEKI